MSKRNPIIQKLSILLIFSFIAAGCSVYQNVTGYFNTYYNTQKVFNDAVTEIQKTPLKDTDTNYFALTSIPKSAADKLDKVIEKTNKVIQLYPVSSWVDNSIVMMGEAYAYKGETESALRKFNELLDNFPGSNLRLETKFWRIKTLYQCKKEDDVLKDIDNITKEAISEGDKNIELQLRMIEAQIYFDRGDYNAAAEKYSSSASIKGDDKLLVYLHSQLALCYERLSEYKYAAKSYEKLREFNPDAARDFKAHLKQGVMLSKASDYNGALDVYDALWEEKLRSEERGLVEVETANNYLAMNDTAKAFPIYRLIDTVYKRSDASAKGSYQLGLWYERKYTDLKSAKQYYDKAKGEYAPSEVTPLATRKSNDLTNYFKHYENIAKYDSLYPIALLNDSVNAALNSLKQSSLEITLKNDSSDWKVSKVDTTIYKKNLDKHLHISEDKINNNKDQPTPQQPEDEQIIITREKSYVVGTWTQDRECLWNIAKKEDVYGNAWMWTKIWQRNRDKIKDPDLIQPKWVLKIPDVHEAQNPNVTKVIDDKLNNIKSPDAISKAKIDTNNIDNNKKRKQEPKLATVSVVEDSLKQTSQKTEKAADLTKVKQQLSKIADTTFVKNDSITASVLKLSDSILTKLNNRSISDSQRALARNIQSMLSKNDSISRTKSLNDTLTRKMEQKNSSDTTKNVTKKSPSIYIKPDSLRILKSQEIFELAGLLNLGLELPDSALNWYQNLVDSFPASPLLPRAYYAMAEIYRSKNDSSIVDSLYKIILSKYEKSEYASQVKKILGMDVSSSELDSASSAYKIGEQFLKNDSTDNAIKQFYAVYKKFRSSQYAPKALYAVGWILESIVVNNDSAASVYKKLLKEYPNSIYALEAKPKIAIKDDPKNLEQYVKIKEIPQLVKLEDGNEKNKSKKETDKKGQNLNKQKDEEIDTNLDEQDQQDEEPPPEDEDDSGGD